MPLDQGHEPEERCGRPPGPIVTRNVHGQSLADAQAAFRAEWEAQVQEKQHQAEQARLKAARCRKLTELIFIGGPVFGAYFGAVIGLIVTRDAGWVRAMQGLTIGAGPGGLFGLVAVMPVLLLMPGCWWFYRRRAQRLERELRKLERS